MRRDDRDDPFDEFFREVERMMNDFVQGTQPTGDPGFGSDTHVDVQESEDAIRVIADLPGVEKADIHLECDGEHLTIAATTEVRDYQDHVTLPARVDEHTASATYNNGVLEVTFERADDARRIDLD